MKWEKIPEIFSVDVFWFLEASAYVLSSNLAWWSVPMADGTFVEVFFLDFIESRAALEICCVVLRTKGAFCRTGRSLMHSLERWFSPHLTQWASWLQ